jgi:hypothetical protein
VPAKSTAKATSRAPKSILNPKAPARAKGAPKKQVLVDVDENAHENVGEGFDQMSDREEAGSSAPVAAAKKKTKTASETYTKVLACVASLRNLN